MKRIISRRWLGPVALVVAISTGLVPASAGVIVEHVGNNDPTTEGFTGLDTTGTDVSVSGVTSPEPAWRTEDTSSSSGLRPRYEYAVTAADYTDIAADGGWRLDARLRIPSLAEVGNNAALQRAVELNTATTQYRMLFNLDDNDNFQVQLVGTGGSTVTLGNVGEFHTVSLVYDNTDASASLFVNGSGTAAVTGYTGSGVSASLANLVRFGAVRSGETGTTEYANVTFATIPEPASLALLGAGALLITKRRASA